MSWPERGANPGRAACVDRAEPGCHRGGVHRRCAPHPMKDDDVFSLWVYLARTPLLWLTVTILAYCACDRVSAALRRHPLANPMLLSVALTGILVLGTH